MLELVFDKGIGNSIITTKNICNRTTIIETIDNVMTIKFQKDIEYSKSYLDQIATFLRNFCIIHGKNITIIDGNIEQYKLDTIKNQSLLIQKNDGQMKAIPIDINKFFEKYKSNTRQYSYINNAFPWLILMYKTGYFVERIRILFTLVDMLSTYLVRTRKIIERFNTFYSNISYSGDQTDSILNLLVDLWQDENIKNNREGFTGIAGIVNGVLNDDKITDNILRISMICYELRNRNFHGNMSPVVTYNSKTKNVYDFIEDITLNGIYTILQKIIEDL